MRGELLRSTADDLLKLRKAWREIARRRAAGEPVWNFTGLERSLRVEASALELMDDELAAALLSERVRELATRAPRRRSGASRRARHEPADGGARRVAPRARRRRTTRSSASRPATATRPCGVRRALAGARFVDTTSVEELEREVEGAALVVVTRLAVTYDAARRRGRRGGRAGWRGEAGARVLVDDAGGARVAPAVFGQPRTLELGVDVGATGLDKYGTVGPRLGLLARRARARGRDPRARLRARPRGAAAAPSGRRRVARAVRPAARARPGRDDEGGRRRTPSLGSATWCTRRR